MTPPPNPHSDGSQSFRLKTFRHPRPALPAGVIPADTPRPIVQVATRRRTLPPLPWEASDRVANDPTPPRTVIALDVVTRLQLHDAAAVLSVNPTVLGNAILQRGLCRLLQQHEGRMPPGTSTGDRATALRDEPQDPLGRRGTKPASTSAAPPIEREAPVETKNPRTPP